MNIAKSYTTDITKERTLLNEFFNNIVSETKRLYEIQHDNEKFLHRLYTSKQGLIFSFSVDNSFFKSVLIINENMILIDSRVQVYKSSIFRPKADMDFVFQNIELDRLFGRKYIEHIHSDLDFLSLVFLLNIREVI